MGSAGRPTISELQAAEILTDFESKYGLFGFSTAGVSIWRLLRFSVSEKLQNLPLEKPPALGRMQLAARVLIGSAQFFGVIFRKKVCTYIVKTYVSALRIRDNNKYRDIYFDDLLDTCPEGIKWQFTNAPGYEECERNAWAPPQVDSIYVNVVGNVLAYLFPFKADKGLFKHVADLVATDLELNDFDEGTIRRIFSSFFWQSKIYGRLLRRMRPKFVIVADAGERALLWACKQSGVRFIELQHGSFSRHHPDSLPCSVMVSDDVDLLLPDTLALYGRYWETVLSDTLLGRGHYIISVGAAVIDRYRRYRSDAYRANPDCPVITFSSQGLDRDNLIRFLQDFLSFCGCRFILQIKLHPTYDDNLDAYVKCLGGDSRVRFSRGKDNPNVYELIALSDLHLSIASACHFDALGLGVPTVVIGLAGYELMSDLLSSGHAIIAMAPQELAGIVYDRRWRPVSEETSEYYFKGNFVENVRPLIE